MYMYTVSQKTSPFLYFVQLC